MKYIKYISILLTVLLSSCSQLADRNPFTNEIVGFDYRFFLIPIIIFGLGVVGFVVGAWKLIFSGENPFSNQDLDDAAYVFSRIFCIALGFLVYNVIIMLILSANGECDIVMDITILCSTVGVAFLLQKSDMFANPFTLFITKVILVLGFFASIGAIIYIISMLG